MDVKFGGNGEERLEQELDLKANFLIALNVIDRDKN